MTHVPDADAEPTSRPRRRRRPADGTGHRRRHERRATHRRPVASAPDTPSRASAGPSAAWLRVRRALDRVAPAALVIFAAFLPPRAPTRSRPYGRCGTRRSATPTGVGEMLIRTAPLLLGALAVVVPGPGRPVQHRRRGPDVLGAIGAAAMAFAIDGAVPQPLALVLIGARRRRRRRGVGGRAGAAAAHHRSQRGDHLAAAQLRRRPRAHLARFEPWKDPAGSARPTRRSSTPRRRCRSCGASGSTSASSSPSSPPSASGCCCARRPGASASACSAATPRPPAGPASGSAASRRRHARRRRARRPRRDDRVDRRRGPAAAELLAGLRLHRLPRLVAGPPPPAQGDRVRRSRSPRSPSAASACRSAPACPAPPSTS